MCIRDRREIFEAQYELTLTEEVEIRYRTETSTDPETGETTTEEVPYEYYILNVTLTNKTLPAVILPRLNEQQREIYTVMQQLKGNKPYLWEGIYNGGEDTGPSYETVSYTHLDVYKRQSLFRHRPLRLKPEDEYTVYEVDGSDTDEEADLLNFDDLDSDEFV